MLEKLFIEILNMSFIGSIVILAILFIRVFLKKVPKKFSYLLWAVALFRLLVPFSFESVLSLIPVNPEPIPADIGNVVTPQINPDLMNVTAPVNNSLPASEAITSVNPMQMLFSIGTVIWIIVMVLLIAYGIGSLIRIKKQLANAVMEEDGVYKSSHISTPFVIGIIKPKIYLPDLVLDSEREYILLHEQTHIKRRDHIFRCISYLALCIHWFNPLVWIAFYVSGKDMEMACDEAVIFNMGTGVKKEYSQSLLNFTTRKVKPSMSPLAFGEGETKGRVKNILNYKKPRTFFIIVAIIGLLIISIGLLANPLKKASLPSFEGNTYKVEEILFHGVVYSFTYTTETAPVFSISSDHQLYTKETGNNEWKAVGGLYEVNLKKDELLSWIKFTDMLDNKVIALLDKTQYVYRADTNNDNDVFYLVFETEDNQILIFYGYAKEEGTSIRWIFEMERLEPLEISLSTTELWRHRTKYVGNSSAIANIAHQLQIPDYLEYKSISLQTKSQPFGATIVLSEKDENVNITLDEHAHVLFGMDACIMFSLVQNVDHVVFEVNGKPMVYTRDWAIETMGIDLWKESEDEESFEELLLKIKEKLTNGSDAPTDMHIASEENVLDQAISNAIINYHFENSNIAGQIFESHINLAIESDESEDEVRVYAMVLYNVIDKKENGLDIVIYSHMPCRITLKKTENDNYEFVEYWKPRDGSYHAVDIRDVFPDAIEKDALDTQKYNLQQNQSCYQQAVKAFNINVNDVIDYLLEQIMSSPKSSSNPTDYIDAHIREYRELTYYGDYTIAYIKNSLETGVTGLKSKILEILLDEMTM